MQFLWKSMHLWKASVDRCSGIYCLICQPVYLSVKFTFNHKDTEARKALLRQISGVNQNGTSLRHLRQRPAIWKQDQPRSQREPPPLEREPPSRARPRKRRQQARARLHHLPQVRQGRQSLSQQQDGVGQLI